MNKHRTIITSRNTYDALCDKCGRVIVSDCAGFSDVAHRAPAGTSFNGDGHYVCPVCNHYDPRNELRTR